MNKLFFIIVLIFNVINNSQCLGITNLTRINGAYIINIASEDVKLFEQKLENRLNNIKSEYNMIFNKLLLSTIGPYIIFIIYKIYKRSNISYILYLIILIIILICDYVYITPQRKDYESGIKSVENAIISLDITKKNYYVDPRKSDFKEGKYDINYYGDEIEKYGIHATFCEIPGTLPSKNANPESYAYSLGGFCYVYDSQRRYLDPEAYNYIGDEESKKYRKIQIKSFDLFDI